MCVFVLVLCVSISFNIARIPTIVYHTCDYNRRYHCNECRHNKQNVYQNFTLCSFVEFYYAQWADICLPSIMLQELHTSCSRVAFNQSLYTVPVVFATAQTVLCTYPLLTSLDAVSFDPWVCTLVRVFQVSISFRSNRLLECFTQVLNTCHNVFYLVWSMLWTAQACLLHSCSPEPGSGCVNCFYCHHILYLRHTFLMTHTTNVWLIRFRG